MSKLRLKISMSLDGFVAGPEQSIDNPLGIGGMRLHEWVFPLAAWRSMHGMPGGDVNESSRVVEESLANIGATVMGRNMFGGHPGGWDAEKPWNRSEEHTSELQSRLHLVCRLLLEKKKKKQHNENNDQVHYSSSHVVRHPPPS